ncbi:hypothetical protein ABFA07_012832 [Porites harrisoni]
MATKSKRGYRWHPKIIRLCIDLYCKNPHVLDPLRKFIILPSNRTIRLYKNKVEEKPGWNDQVLKWCLETAQEKNLREEDYWGGFVIDEMKIQESLEMVVKHGKHRLVGFVDLGEGHDLMTSLSGKTEPQLATHVLQFIFISDSGFRFPVAQFPSGECSPSDLYFNFWKGVRKMLEFGFVIYWSIMDGADCNRQFIRMHFRGRDPVKDKFITSNIHTGTPMVFVMDPKHNIKKIRNNIEKSNASGKPRCLMIKGKNVTWQYFKDAFNWDQKSFSLPLHEKLTDQHFNLDPASKMRNHLAEDVLDDKMLFLMQKYQENMMGQGKDSSHLDSTISLLVHTSKLVNLFNDKLVIRSNSDPRLGQLNQFHKYMNDWRSESSENNNQFVSSKLWFDLQSMCLGFGSMVAVKQAQFPQSIIKPAIINQDGVENHFCQVRSCNGQNNNPTYLQQESTQNSIRFGQTTISPKSNVGAANEHSSSACSMPTGKRRKTAKTE